MATYKPTFPVLQDKIHINSPQNQSAKETYLIYMIPGNPGVAEYYRLFLNALSDRLSANPKIAGDKDVHLVCKAMAGFEIASSFRRKGPVGLIEQIDFVEGSILDSVAEVQRDMKGGEVKVVLMGHSVGAYILLEVVRRLRGRLGLKFGKVGDDGSVVSSLKGSVVDIAESLDKYGGKAMQVVSGICLFPTVVDIGKSKQGLAMSKMARIPFLAFILGMLLKLILFFIPLRRLTSIVRSRDGQSMSFWMAYVSASWLKIGGVRQALHMGFDEMRLINHDSWDEEVWGAASPPDSGIQRTKLFFYFGKNDHWVANSTRDDLMRLRARGDGKDEWRPVMEIDEGDVPHAFVVNHSEEVADKVAEYIGNLVDVDESQ